MKQIFRCEKCGAEYDTEKEALECEAIHKKEAEERAKIAERKHELEKTINELMEKYYDEFHKFPIITIKSHRINLENPFDKFWF